MKIGIMIGTRPEIIKMSPIIRHCQKSKLDFFIIHSNQHYSHAMDEIFFQDLELQRPKYNLAVASSASHLQADHVARTMLETEKVLLKEKPDVLLVHGDTNTTLAGAITAKKMSQSKEKNQMNVRLGHVEAGLRSFDRSMPEEVNRVIVDHLSDYLFVPTEIARQNAIREGIEKNKIIETGNTIIDAVLENREIANKRKSVIKDLNLKKKKYFLLTAHRPENVDNKEKLSMLLDTLSTIEKEYGFKVVYPIHPRTEKMIAQFSLKIPKNIMKIAPVGFLEFLQLQQHAALVLTDSGGIQEEACILGVPCITLRENTERLETLSVGSNVLVGINKKRTLEAIDLMMSKKSAWKNPFGERGVAKRIINYLFNNN